MDVNSSTVIASHLVAVPLEQLYAHMLHLLRSENDQIPHRGVGVTYEIAVPF